MAEDNKTEEATPRRRKKEREKGNIAKSQDMNSALVLFASVLICIFLSPSMMEKLKEQMVYAFGRLNPAKIAGSSPVEILQPFMLFLDNILFPFMILVFIVTILAIWSQIGTLFTVSRLKPSFEKLTPKAMLNNAKKMLNLFEPRNMVEFVKSLLKMIVVFFSGYAVINARKSELFGLLGASPETGLAVIGSILIQMIITICIMLLFIGFIDKKYQTYEYEKSIKMTKQEIKDEYKDLEGDPKIKSKIKGEQMKFAQQRMMSGVPQADVVVTNPTHFAVALKYDKNVAPAPIVIAKGADFLAFRIREIAENNNVPIVENRPLARALYRLVPVDGMIPAELYLAVAEVLAWVYNRNKR